MAHQSLYRKYRSQTFGDLVGQEHIVRTLQNAISTGRIAHAYLFTGPRGTGKTSSARLLAKALNAENGPTPEPSDDDPICQMIAAGNCPDVQEFDAASEAGVDDVREAIVEDVQYQPMMCRYKIYIIDEVHDLSGKAFDALLKTIEEPPSHVIFILATTEYSKVPPTIRSRCQKFEFHRGSVADLAKRIQYVAEHEGVKIEPAAVSAIARMADGGFRDALTLLEQAIITADGEITLEQVYDQLGLVSDEAIDEILSAIQASDVPKLIDSLNEISRLGRDPRAIVESMLYRLADLTRSAYGVEIGGTADSAREASLHAAAQTYGREFLLYVRSVLSELHKSIRDISLPRLWLESELIRIAKPIQAAPVVVEAREAKATPQKPTPKAKPEAVNPEPTQKAEPTREQPPVAPPPTGDPVFDSVCEAWVSSVDELSKVSKTMAARLAESKIGSVEGTRVYIEFARQIDLEWIKDKSNRTTAIVEAMQKRLGENHIIELGVGKRNAMITTQAVELPLEGQKLADTVREIFGTN